jgi:chemotaxis signal transduction protein
MTNQLTHLESNNSELSKASQVASLLKLIVFDMGSLKLALRIESVYKIVNYTATYGTGFGAVGVAHLGESEITVVNLHRRFFKSSQSDESHQSSYLVVVQHPTGELYGIPVSQTPTLLEVPVSLIRVLPESYRRADTLDVARHVAVIPQEEEPLTIFLLDVDRLLPIF